MPVRRGITRRRNVQGGTTTASMSFSKKDYLWLNEQANMRIPQVSVALILEEAIEYYRQAVDRALTDEIREAKGRNIKAGMAAAALARSSGLATSTPPPPADDAVLL